MKRMPVLALVGAIFLAVPASAQEKAAPLFSNNDTIDIVINGPIKALARRAEYSTEARPATLTAQGETHAIELSPRGVSRRNPEICQFPPLSVYFVVKPTNDSFFNMQRKLKLVTHCREGEQYQQYVLREYAAYRIYNAITPKSLKVRLVRVHYLDDGKNYLTSWGFLIEDIDDAAKRLGGEELEVEKVPSSAFNPDDAARVALFQFMIGNLDWAITDGPGSDDCCHNSKLVGETAASRTNLFAIPYDFDFSGLVNTPYAVPPYGFPVRRVTQRYFNGFCKFNSSLPAAIAEFKAARPTIEANLAGIPDMSNRTRSNMAAFLGDFWQDIATPASVEKELISDCR